MQLLAEAGQTFRGKTLTPEMIADVVSTFDEVGRAPLTFGHPTGQDEPKAGDVLRVASSADNTELYGDIKALDKVTEAVDEGFFDDRSVGIARSEDGEHYLHHVALLGGTPPQIKGMEPLSSLPIDFSEEEEVMHFGSGDEVAESTLARLAERLLSYFADADELSSGDLVRWGPSNATRYGRVDEVHTSGEPQSDTSGEGETSLSASEDNPVFEIQHAQFSEGEWSFEETRTVHRAENLTKIDELPERSNNADSPNSRSDDMPDSEETTDFSDLSREELEARLKEQESEDGSDGSGESGSGEADEFADSELYQDMKSELERQRSERRESEIQSVREAASGKMPASAVDQFADLAKALPGSVETATFADDDEASPEEVSPRQKLADALSQLPDQVEPGAMDFSDLEENGEGKKDLAGEM
jgi:hypothetical protein